MDNQHRKITGYRDLDADEISKMNIIKAKGEELKALINALERSTADPRSVAIAKTKLQEGIMWAVRSVAKPESF